MGGNTMKYFETGLFIYLLFIIYFETWDPNAPVFEALWVSFCCFSVV